MKLKAAIIHFSVHRYKLIAVAIVLFTLVTGAFIPLITIDTDPENMLEKNEPVRVFHNESKKQFNLSETIVMGVINESNPDGVFNPATLRRVYELTEYAKALRWKDKKHPDQSSGVIEADMVAPSLVDHLSQQGPGTIKFEWLMPRPPETREEALAIRDKALSNPLLKGRMISEDGKALCIYLPLTEKKRTSVSPASFRECPNATCNSSKAIVRMIYGIWSRRTSCAPISGCNLPAVTARKPRKPSKR